MWHGRCNLRRAWMRRSRANTVGEEHVRGWSELQTQSDVGLLGLECTWIVRSCTWTAVTISAASIDGIDEHPLIPMLGSSTTTSSTIGKYLVHPCVFSLWPTAQDRTLKRIPEMTERQCPAVWQSRSSLCDASFKSPSRLHLCSPA